MGFLAQGSRLLLKHATIQTGYVKIVERLKCQKRPTYQTSEPVFIAMYCINILELILIITVPGFQIHILRVKNTICLRVFAWLLKLDPRGLMHEMLNTRHRECPYLTSIYLAPSIVWIMNNVLVYSCNLSMVLKGRLPIKFTVITFMDWCITPSLFEVFVYCHFILTDISFNEHWPLKSYLP